MSDDHAQMIADCEQRESRLSEWEQGFIDHVSHQLRQGRSLTTKEAAKLDEIWNKATEDG